MPVQEERSSVETASSPLADPCDLPAGNGSAMALPAPAPAAVLDAHPEAEEEAGTPLRLQPLPGHRFCGVPDLAEPAGGGLRLRSFGAPGGRWTRGALRVSIQMAGARLAADLTPDSARRVIESAFAQWQAAATFFTFTFVAPGEREDIRVAFVGRMVDGRFGTAGGVLATGSYPEGGDLRLDNVETWGRALLLQVALHEVGHLLGLSHSNLPGGTMYPFLNSASVVDTESRDAVRALYGWRPQSRLGDRATTHRAALGTTQQSNFTNRFTTLHMVWKGTGNDSGIYHSVFDGAQWGAQQRVPGVGCSVSPALTEVPVPGSPVPATGLLMAWKGIGNDSGLYWSRWFGRGWEAQRRVPGVGCSAAPALARANGQVYMAWKGVGDDTGIYWSTHDGAEGWAAQSRVRGVGTSDSPALVAVGTRLYLFWKGVPGDSNAYWTSMDVVTERIWRPQRRIEYFDYETDGGVALAIGTSGALSATRRGARILLAWKGVGGDTSIWFSLFKNNEFSGQVRVANVGTAVGPGVADVDGRTFMAWRGIGGDSNVWWSVLP